MSKKEVADWAYEQFDKYGVRKPETYTPAELKYLCPDIPTDFIDEHVKTRDKLREDSAQHWGYTLAGGWPRWCPEQMGLSNEHDKI